MTLSFDFEQNFPLPHIPTGEVFYLRQVWLHVCIRNTRLWQQQCHNVLLAQKSYSQRLYRSGFLPSMELNGLIFFPTRVVDRTKTPLLYSTSILWFETGAFIVFVMFSLCEGTLSYHATENSPKLMQRNAKLTPQQWMDILRSARKRNPYNVVEVEQSMIYDFQSHFSTFCKKTVTNIGERMRIRDAKQFEYSQDYPKRCG